MALEAYRSESTNIFKILFQQEYHDRTNLKVQIFNVQ